MMIRFFHNILRSDITFVSGGDHEIPKNIFFDGHCLSICDSLYAQAGRP